jgi:hypothetical protein
VSKIEPEDIKEEIEELKEKIDERRVQYGYEELNACGCTCKEDCAISAVIKVNRLGNYCEQCQKCISKELASVFKRHKKSVVKPEFHEGE